MERGRFDTSQKLEGDCPSDFENVRSALPCPRINVNEFEKAKIIYVCA
jgi:hypothetical protein